MKTCNSLIAKGPSNVLLIAAVLVVATGCVEERVTHVHQAYPVAVEAPAPPPPPPLIPEPAPIPIPPPQVISLPSAPPPAPLVLLRSAAELDRMLAPLALYPDPLLAQILPAATVPEQVVMADRYVRDGGDLNQVDAQPWDHSLKALARYPAVLRMLDDNLAWTTDLGQAFLNQPAAVMDSVQRLRAQARAVGNLQSTPQQTVVVSDGTIEILPASPQVIYVPVYQPQVVYVQPPPAPGRFHISFGVGFVVGAWLNHDCDWHHHEVIVWHHDHPRPADWWSGPPARREAPTVVNNVTVVNNTTIVNNNVTVWRPQNRGVTADRGDRGWVKPDARPTVVASQNGETKPLQRPIVAQAQPSAPVREARPTVPVKAPPTSQPVAQPPPVRPVESPPSSAREAARPAPVNTRSDPRGVQRPAAQPPSVTPSQSSPVVAPAPVGAPALARGSNARPQSARETRPVAEAKPAIAAPKDPRPAAVAVAARQPSVPVAASRPTVAPTASRPAAPVRAPASALTVETSQAARQASVRGEQSRQAIARPVAASRPAAPVAAPKATPPKGNPGETKRPQQKRLN